ncbi:hypothetical protein BDV19DRAFT_390145 [Aspergillus venezuelensis]
MFPDWLRVILTILTLASFLPQLNLIWTRKNASGIALSYVLLDLIAATEQFAVNFGFIALFVPSDGIFVHDPIIVGDWLDLVQTTLFWVLFVANYGRKRVVLAVYAVYLFVSIIPPFICAIILRLTDDKNAYRACLHSPLTPSG